MTGEPQKRLRAASRRDLGQRQYKGRPAPPPEPKARDRVSSGQRRLPARRLDVMIELVRDEDGRAAPNAERCVEAGSRQLRIERVQRGTEQPDFRRRGAVVGKAQERAGP